MKAPVTSISFALLCFLLGLENASAFMGFSFGNLLFAVNLCKLPGKHCHINCHGPLAPKTFCDNQCTSSSDSSTRRLESSSTTEFAYSQGACDGFDSSTDSYATCMTVAQANCEDTLDESDATYVDGANYSEVSDYNGGTSSSNGSTPIASKLSFLPYMIAAIVASMFLVLYVWREKVSNRKIVSAGRLFREHKKDVLCNLRQCFSSQRFCICFTFPHFLAPEQGKTTPK